MPTQSATSPVESEGALGRRRVEVDSRIHEPLPTGPVLNDGPNPALTEDTSAARAMADSDLKEGISEGIFKKDL